VTRKVVGVFVGFFQKAASMAHRGQFEYSWQTWKSTQDISEIAVKITIKEYLTVMLHHPRIPTLIRQQEQERKINTWHLTFTPETVGEWLSKELQELNKNARIWTILLKAIPLAVKFNGDAAATRNTSEIVSNGHNRRIQRQAAVHTVIPIKPLPCQTNYQMSRSPQPIAEKALFVPKWQAGWKGLLKCHDYWIRTRRNVTVFGWSIRLQKARS
jgi:hypothetical protein